MPAYSPFRIEIRSPDRAHRRRFPTQQFVSASWARERYGGYGAFTLVTAALVKGGLPAIQPGDQVEFWYRGQRRYRGVVQARRPSKEDVEKLSIEGAGVSAALAKQLYAKDPAEGVYYAYPGGGKDASVAFGDIGKDFLLPATAPGGLPLIEVVQASPIGTLITTLDGRKKLSGDILNDWVTQTGNLAAWGCDVDSLGRNRAYGRPITPLSAPADWVIPVPGANVDTAQAELQSADIVNCGLFVGDNAQYPQMLANGNFALPTFYQEGAGNVITDGDFEARSGTLSGGAAFKGTGGVEGDPFSGSTMVECDHVGESVSKSGPFTGAVAGHNYTFGIRAKKEVAAQIADGHATCQIKDGNGSVIQTFSLVVAPLGTAWDYFSQTQVLLPGAASWSVVAQADHIQGVGSDQGGLLLDALELFDSDVAYQTGFQALGYGTGQMNAVNWLYQDAAFTGKYCVYLKVTAQDQDYHDAHLEPLGRAPIKVGVKQGVRFSLQYRSPAQAVQGLPQLRLELFWVRSDGSLVSKNATNLPAQAINAAFQYVEVVAGAPQDATAVVPALILRGSGELCVDAMSLRDSAAPASEGVPVSQYVPEGPLTTFLRADDATLGLPAAAQASINANGTLAGIDQVGSLIRLGDLRAVGVASLSATALEVRRPDVTLLGDERVFWPGQSVRLAGTDGPSLAPTPLSIARVQETLDASDMILRTGLHVEKPQPSDVLTTKKLIQQELNKRLIPGAGTSSAAGGSGGAGGGGATTPVTLQTITESATDPTTHDQVRTGPHVADAERTSWAGTATEVVAARTRTVKGISYTTTEGRLDAMEIDIAHGILPGGTADGQTLRWNAATSGYVADPLTVNNGAGTLTLTAPGGSNTGLTVVNSGTTGTDFPALVLGSHDAYSTIYVTNHAHPLGCITGYYTVASDGYRFLGADGQAILSGWQNGDGAARGVFQAGGFKAGDGSVGISGTSGGGDTVKNGLVTALGTASASVTLSITAPAGETAGAAGAVGTATTAARADHVHAMPAAYPPTAHAGSHGAGGSDPVSPASIGAESLANKGVASGYAGLDAGGKIPTNQLPASIIGALEYQGVWDANANSPTLASGVGTKGFYYKVSVAGSTTLDGNSAWHVGDWAAFDGTTWDKIDNYEAVTSVAGRVGAITLSSTDIAGLGTAATQNTTAFDASGAAVAAQAASLQKSSNLSDLASAATARTNLGLGTAAVANLPATGANASAVQVVRGDDTRLGTGAAFSAPVPADTISVQQNTAVSPNVLTAYALNQATVPNATEGDSWEWQSSTNAGSTWSASTYVGDAFPLPGGLASGTVRFRARLNGQNGTSTAWTSSADVTYQATSSGGTGGATIIAPTGNSASDTTVTQLLAEFSGSTSNTGYITNWNTKAAALNTSTTTGSTLAASAKYLQPGTNIGVMLHIGPDLNNGYRVGQQSDNYFAIRKWVSGSANNIAVMSIGAPGNTAHTLQLAIQTGTTFSLTGTYDGGSTLTAIDSSPISLANAKVFVLDQSAGINANPSTTTTSVQLSAFSASTQTLALPAASSSNRGQMYLGAPSGKDDVLYISRQKADGTYAMAQITLN